MNRLGDAAARRRPWKGAALALGLAVVALLLLLALNLEPSGPGLVLTAVMAGAALMIFVAALTWHLAVRLARAQFGELLRESRCRFAPELAAPWSALGGQPARGYEIHHGRTAQHPALPEARPVLFDELGEPVGWQHGPVLGHYLHGLFEDERVLAALFDRPVRPLDRVFDELADYVDRHFEPGALAGLLSSTPPASSPSSLPSTPPPAASR
ncbi:hypothetical protein [Mitsuaria sp. TWR114]|uniref:hypothetical protein n=1 Tax=Mitsuaria sp. TWR114 TaxID=2601731 RepID=UPI00210369B2|nr:hypothetical protein [Mitsuaria sp. TWR114]